MDYLWYLRDWWTSRFNRNNNNDDDDYSAQRCFYVFSDKILRLERKIDLIADRVGVKHFKRADESSTEEDEDDSSDEDGPIFMKRASSTTTGSIDSDGSNLVIYSKPNINNTTRLQYVTGHRDELETRKRMYDGVMMDKLYEAHGVNEPANKIAKLEKNIVKAGLRCEYAGQNGTVVYADQDTVKRLIQDTL